MKMSILKPHVSLSVRNLQESIEFYRRLFDVEPVRVREDYAKFDLESPGLNLALNVRPFTKGIGTLNHLGVQVNQTDDVLAIRSRLQQTGMLTQDEFQTNCCYALQDKIWVTDPDGNGWEFFVVLDREQGDVDPSMESQCCVTDKQVSSSNRSVCC
jgi:catechol 2,3-dioxygenase-like lactoylglutathione lyase family enzyme